MTEDLTCDNFLGGRVTAWQPKSGYRAGTDPVFLAAACPAKSGQSVLELGCGVGVAALCLLSRVVGLHVTGVERVSLYADFAHRNAAAHGAAFHVVHADLAAMPFDLRQKSFDHVIANPPYFRAGAGTPSENVAREGALREETPLGQWVAVAGARLKPKGWLTMIQTADRFPDCLQALAEGFGSISVLPLTAREGRPANRIILKARKGGAAPFKLLPPFVIHGGAEHLKDGDDYTAEAVAVLRDGFALPLAN